MNKAPIHVWVGGLGQTGGIESYSVACLEALAEIRGHRALRVFSKNDPPATPSPSASPAGPPHLKVHRFGHLRGMQRTLAFAIKGLAWALRERPAFVLTTHPHFTKALAWLPGVPCLSSAHGIEVWGHLSGPLGGALRSTTGVLPVSNFTRRVLEQEGRIPASRLQVVPNTFREALFAPGPKPAYLLERYGLRPDQPLLLTISRLSATERYKGQDQILLALSRLKTELPDLRYLIGGRGDDEPRLRQMAAELNVADRVIFTGYVPESELADHYRLGDLYVMPSTGEGFGIVFLEALACGLPCLAGNEDASPEALDGGRLGLVVPPRDPAAIAAAILSFVRQTHGKPWLHQPETLHAEVTRLFGFPAFKQRLHTALNQLLVGIADLN